jgi:transposase-like protein
MHSIDKAGRRWHSKEFKREAVLACRAPGVSLAAVALEKRINANLLRRWVKSANSKASAASIVQTVLAAPAASTAKFIPVKVSEPVKRDDERPIRIEVRKGPTQIVVEWPVTSAAACAAWLRDLLG